LTQNLPFVVVVVAVTPVVVMSIPIHHLLARVPNLCANAQQSKVIKWGEKNAKKVIKRGKNALTISCEFRHPFC
jgi:hypothetical protein